MEISTQFIWAPYAKRHNKDLGGDTRKVFPYEAIVGELFGDGEIVAATDDALKDIAVSRAGGLATAQLVKREAMQDQLGKAVAGVERCELTVGQGKHQVWDRFCSRPTAVSSTQAVVVSVVFRDRL